MDIIPTNTTIKHNQSLIDKCIVYLFSPRHLPNHFIRPLQYSFSPLVLDEFTKSLHQDNSIRKFLKSEISKSSLKPDTNGIVVKSQLMSELWTFLIVIDGASLPSPIKIDDPSIPLSTPIQPKNIRVLLTGYFKDEPVNINTINANFTNPTFNPHAQMVITRKVVFNRSLSPLDMRNNNGIRLQHNNLTSIYIDGLYEHRANTSSKNLFQLTPNSISESLEDENSQLVTTAPFNKSLNFSPQVISADWENPDKHIANVISAVKNSTDAVLGDYNLVGESVPFLDDYLCQDIKENLSVVSNPEYTLIKDSSNPFINPSEITIDFNRILQLDPDVHIIKNPTHSQLSVVDTSEYLTPETVYSSILESCIPSLLLKWNLSSIAFTYDSYSNYLEIFSVEAVDNVPHHILESSTNGFLSEVQNQLFPFLKVQCGDFVTNISSTIYGSSLINLKFYDFNTLGDEDYIEHVNTLGGLTSNMIGNQDHFVNNSMALQNMIQSVSNNLESGIDVINEQPQPGFREIV